jgi:hypothetical protein
MKTKITVAVVDVTPPNWPENAPALMTRRLITSGKVRFGRGEYPVRLASAYLLPGGKHEVDLELYHSEYGIDYLLATPINPETDPYWAAGLRLRKGALLTPKEYEKVGYTEDWLVENDRYREFGFAKPQVWWRQGDAIVVRLPGTGTTVYCNGIRDAEDVSKCTVVLLGTGSHAVAFPPGHEMNIEEAKEMAFEIVNLDLMPGSFEDAIISQSEGDLPALHAASLASGGAGIEKLAMTLSKRRQGLPDRSDEFAGQGEIPEETAKRFAELLGKEKPKKATAKVAIGPKSKPVEETNEVVGAPLDQLEGLTVDQRKLLIAADFATIEGIKEATNTIPPKLKVAKLPSSTWRKIRRLAEAWQPKVEEVAPEAQETQPKPATNKPTRRKTAKKSVINKDDDQLKRPTKGRSTKTTKAKAAAEAEEDDDGSEPSSLTVIEVPSVQDRKKGNSSQKPILTNTIGEALERAKREKVGSTN